MKSNCYLFVKVEMNFSNKKKTKRVGPKRFYVGITLFVNILFKRRSVEKNVEKGLDDVNTLFQRKISVCDVEKTKKHLTSIKVELVRTKRTSINLNLHVGI